MKKIKHPSIRFWSILTGLSIFLMAIAAGYAYGFSFLKIHVENNPIETMNNIKLNSTLFYSGAVVWLIILLTDLIASYGIYKYLSVFHKPFALCAGSIRLIYSIILGLGIITLFKGNTQGFLNIWSFGLIIFGVHLLVTGIASFYSYELSNVLSILLIFAGLSYILVNGMIHITPTTSELSKILERILSIPMTIGELSFAIWLVFKGGKLVDLL